MQKEVLSQILEKHRADLPEHVFPFRSAMAQREIISGVSQSLDEIKQANSGAKLAAKHAILTAAVNGGSIFSIRQVVKALSVHPRNIMLALERRGAMDADKFHDFRSYKSKVMVFEVFKRSLGRAGMC
jgi:hypothetical protein